MERGMEGRGVEGLWGGERVGICYITLSISFFILNLIWDFFSSLGHDVALRIGIYAFTVFGESNPKSESNTSLQGSNFEKIPLYGS